MTDEPWAGRPLDEPGRDERERSAYELHDAQETARHLGVSVLDVQEWEGRLAVRAIRPPHVRPPQTPEESEQARLANELGPRLLSDSWSEEMKAWQRKHPVD